jgi:protoheme IX farnesyltransferase
MKHYIELTKPRITWLILMSTGVGYYFGIHPGTSSDWHTRAGILLLFHTMLGTGLIASGTAALNQWAKKSVRPHSFDHCILGLKACVGERSTSWPPE